MFGINAMIGVTTKPEITWYECKLPTTLIRSGVRPISSCASLEAVSIKFLSFFSTLPPGSLFDLHDDVNVLHALLEEHLIEFRHQ